MEQPGTSRPRTRPSAVRRSARLRKASPTPASPESAAKKARVSSSDDKEQCSVCMEDVDAMRSLAFLPCQHEFHRTCAVTWLESQTILDNQTCPLCRKRVPQIRANERTEDNKFLAFGGTQPTHAKVLVLKRHLRRKLEALGINTSEQWLQHLKQANLDELNIVREDRRKAVEAQKPSLWVEDIDKELDKLAKRIQSYNAINLAEPLASDDESDADIGVFAGDNNFTRMVRAYNRRREREIQQIVLLEAEARNAREAAREAGAESSSSSSSSDDDDDDDEGDEAEAGRPMRPDNPPPRDFLLIGDRRLRADEEFERRMQELHDAPGFFDSSDDDDAASISTGNEPSTDDEAAAAAGDESSDESSDEDEPVLAPMSPIRQYRAPSPYVSRAPAALAATRSQPIASAAARVQAVPVAPPATTTPLVEVPAESLPPRQSPPLPSVSADKDKVSVPAPLIRSRSPLIRAREAREYSDSDEDNAAVSMYRAQYFNQLMQAEQAARRSRREEHAEDVNTAPARASVPHPVERAPAPPVAARAQPVATAAAIGQAVPATIANAAVVAATSQPSLPAPLIRSRSPLIRAKEAREYSDSDEDNAAVSMYRARYFNQLMRAHEDARTKHQDGRLKAALVPVAADPVHHPIGRAPAALVAAARVHAAHAANSATPAFAAPAEITPPRQPELLPTPPPVVRSIKDKPLPARRCPVAQPQEDSDDDSMLLTRRAENYNRLMRTYEDERLERARLQAISATHATPAESTPLPVVRAPELQAVQSGLPQAPGPVHIATTTAAAAASIIAASDARIDSLLERYGYPGARGRDVQALLRAERAVRDAALRAAYAAEQSAVPPAPAAGTARGGRDASAVPPLPMPRRSTRKRHAPGPPTSG